jgi:hypothetical protein
VAFPCAAAKESFWEDLEEPSDEANEEWETVDPVYFPDHACLTFSDDAHDDLKKVLKAVGVGHRRPSILLGPRMPGLCHMETVLQVGLERSCFGLESGVSESPGVV